MKQYRLGIAVLACAFILAVASPSRAEPAGDVIPGRYIVELKQDGAPDKVIAAHGVAADFVYTSAIKGFAGFIPPGQLKKLQEDPAVKSIVPDRVMRAVQSPAVQGKPGKPAPPPATSQVVPEGVKRIGADPAQGGSTGAGVGVAIVDTGLDFAHQDLPVGARSFTAYGASAQDDAGHGTHVGGIVAAINNARDVVGVAPDATLYAVKVLNNRGEGTDATILAGLNWIQANALTLNPPIRVVNMSLGRAGTLADNPALRTAVQTLHAAGIAVVVTAGNDSGLEVRQQVPATYPEVLAVASTTAGDGSAAGRYAAILTDTASYFTSDGMFTVDAVTGLGIGVTVSAPGEDQENVSRAGMITSVGILSTKLGGGTVRMSGTSMAAPHVAGVVARYFGASWEASASHLEAVRDLIRSNADRKGTAPLNSPTLGYTYDQAREGVVRVP